MTSNETEKRFLELFSAAESDQGNALGNPYMHLDVAIFVNRPTGRDPMALREGQPDLLFLFIRQVVIGEGGYSTNDYRI
jgi:hypothetical protein